MRLFFIIFVGGPFFILGAVLLVGGSLMAYQAYDCLLNYTRVGAVITSTEVDCFVRKKKQKITNPVTHELVYMACGEARLQAEKRKFDADAVKERVKMTFRYTSHIDGQEYDGKFTRTDNVDYYKQLETFILFAHDEEPHKTFTPGGNPFLANWNI